MAKPYDPSKVKGTPEWEAAQKKKKDEKLFSHKKTHPEMYDKDGKPIPYSTAVKKLEEAHHSDHPEQKTPDYPDMADEDPEITIEERKLEQKAKTGTKDDPLEGKSMEEVTFETKTKKIPSKDLVWIEDDAYEAGGYYVRENIKRGKYKAVHAKRGPVIKRTAMVDPTIHPMGDFGGGGKMVKVFGGGPKSQIIRKADFEDVGYLKSMGLTITGAKTNPKVKDRWYSDSGDILGISEFTIEQRRTANEDRESFVQLDKNTGDPRFLTLGFGNNSMQFSMKDIPGVVDQVRRCRVCQRPDWQFDFGDPGSFKRQKSTCAKCAEKRIIKPRKQIRNGQEVSIPFEFEWDYATIGQMITPSRMNKRKKVRPNHVQMFLRKVFAVDERGRYPIGYV